MTNAEALDDFIFNLKFQSKQLHREAQKEMKDVDKLRAKAKKEIERGYRDAAEVYAQEAIAHLNFNSKYIKMACRMDIIAGELKSQEVNTKVTKEIGRLNKVVSKCVNSEALVENEKVYDHFNSVCDMLGVQQATIDTVMGATDNVEDVSKFMSQLETEIAVEEAQKINNVPEINVESNEQADTEENEDIDNLKDRLAEE